MGGYWNYKIILRSQSQIGFSFPSFNLYDEKAPIYTNPLFLPGSIINACKITQSIISDGCIINNAEIHNSVLGIRSIIGENAIIKDSIIMGADYYESESNIRTNRFKKIPDIGIGNNSRIVGAIIDKNVHIGANVSIENTKKIERLDEKIT